MAYNFLPYDQDQLYLLSPSIREWVGEESLARCVSDVVGHFDDAGKLAAFYAPRRTDGWGRASYHPVLMVKVLLYGYAIGVRSSRKLAQALEESVPLRYLAANQQPDFRTISAFRQEHLAALEELFREVLELCGEAGLVTLGRVALDGRKVKANAALERNRTREQLRKEVQAILAEAERIDREEDGRYGPDRRGDELPAGLRTREDRLQRLRDAQARLEARQRAAEEETAEKMRRREAEERAAGKKKRGRKPKSAQQVGQDLAARAKTNLTDPESRILKTRRGWVQGYNGQAVVDCSSQVIVAADLTQAENDVGQLAPMLERCEQDTGRRPAQCVADAGYWSEENAGLETGATELFIATTKDWKQRKALREHGPPRGRIPKDHSVRDRMERKLRTKRGRAIYGERSSTVEPVFGQMHERGLNEFLLRGVAKARGEWSLFATTHNLLKLWRSGWRLAPARG